MKNLKKLLITVIAGIAFATSSGCISTKAVKPDQKSAELFQAQYPGAEYKSEGWPVPDVNKGYKVMLKEYGKLDESSIPKCFRDMYKEVKWGGYCPGQFNDDSKVYVVVFQNKQGDKVTKYYHKTHPFAYTIQNADEDPYTVFNTGCIKTYDAKIPGSLKYEIYEEKPTSSGVRMRTPEPDDFNPYEDDPLSTGQWTKACEWWKLSDINGQ